MMRKTHGQVFLREEFYRLNEALWEIYAKCEDGEQVIKAQNEYLKRIDEEDAAMRQIDPLEQVLHTESDSDESDESEYSENEETERLTDAFGNWIV